jgi:mRNA interferase MazF
MRRGEIWTVSGGSDYAGKPRPVVIVQDDAFAETSSITICPFTSNPLDEPLLRVAIAATPENGLVTVSRIMIDKITTVPKAKIGRRVGQLSDQDRVRLNRALIVFLGLAG